MKKAPRQCQATTLANTYSAAHQCLKRTGLSKLGPRLLCAHHRAAVERSRA